MGPHLASHPAGDAHACGDRGSLQASAPLVQLVTVVALGQRSSEGHAEVQQQQQQQLAVAWAERCGHKLMQG